LFVLPASIAIAQLILLRLVKLLLSIVDLKAGTGVLYST
jgi:hypothetical protein